MVFKRFSLLFILFILVLLFASGINIKANEFDDEGLIITKVNLNDDFSEDVVIVVLKHRVSLEFIDYTTEDFSEIDCVKVEDLTVYTTKIVKDEIEANNTGDFSKLKERIDKNMLVDIDKFHRILCLYLNNPGKENVIEAIRKLEKRNDIISAEPDYIEQLKKESNDTYFFSGDQWGLNGEFGINSTKAWNYSTGDSGLLVGVIDSGIDASHPDLMNNINDNLHRDYVDHPWYTTFRNVPKSDLEDTDGHGTHVAGIIGAQGNNNIGVSGTLWNVKLVSLRVFGPSGGSAADVKRAIDYATEEYIRILNYSGGGSDDHNGRKVSIQNYPGLFVCAAGNDNQDNDLNDFFPSNYSFSNLIAVGAINSDGYKRLSSNYGQTTVDIFAPGGDITSTWPLDLYDSSNDTHISIGYRTTGGTSMATPFVTGVAALMLSINSSLTPQQIKATIMNNATKYSALDNLCVCEGRLDAYKAVSAVALDSDTIGNNIKINGFINGYTPPSNMELTIPESFAQISSTYGTSIQNVQIIGSAAFYNQSNIKSIELPNTITSIDSYAFENCSGIQEIDFGINPVLTNIGVGAFKGCSALSNIEIPDNVSHVDSYAFNNCTNLSNVIIQKEKGPITNLGLNAFDNCASNLTITVPTNRVCEYKNTPFWSSYRDKIVPSSPIVDDIDLACMVDDDVTTYLNAGYNKLYRLDVECDGWYTISCTSGTHYSIYNSNMVKIAGSYGTYELSLNEGTYYIDIEWEDPTDSGYATLHFLNKGINVSDNITNNILPHLHQVGLNDYRVQLKYYNNQGPGFYSISVNATSINPITYYEGTITFYSNYNRTTVINKYNDNNYTLSAKSSLGANNMVMYFDGDGFYYFDVILRTNDLTALTLNINPLTSTSLNLFDLSTSTNEGVELLNNDIKGDYFKKVLLKQSGKFEITGEYKDYSSENAYVLVARIVPSGSSYSLDVKLISVINDNIISASATWNLDPGTYYIGYFNNIEGVEIGISFERKITQYGSYNLISDPDANEDYGSEVRFNNGSYLGSTLTVGFTRFIYLNYDYILPSYSRLDYYFYSSNENIATISEYGTLLGKSAGTVKIMVVYKSDPSITFVKQFTILADNRVNNLIIYDTDSIDYTGSGQIYQIELDDYNSYFPQISLYNWTLISSSNNYSYSISEWGTFSLSGTDIIVIEGTSQLNSKLKIRITITVTN